jgi:hypothetical protein
VNTLEQQGLTNTLAERSCSGREFWVIFTGTRDTSNILTMVEGLASRLSAHICVLAAQVVPYPLPLSEPDVRTGFLRQTLLKMILEHDLDASVQICLCRNPVEALDTVLPGDAIVVVGGRRRWWRTAEQRMAGALAKKQRAVFFLDPTKL